MTEFYLDEDLNVAVSPITNSDVSSWANHFQKRYFSACEAAIEVAINTNTKFQKAAAFDPATMVIHISQKLTQFRSLAKIALLHEMIHVKLYLENDLKDGDKEHGARFKAELKRLVEEGAYDPLL
jgi:predicted transcriptional regulator